METKLVIFDLDGTLLNTIADLGHACNHALEIMNLPTHPIEDYNYMVGNGLRKLIERAAGTESSPFTHEDEGKRDMGDTDLIDKLIALCKEFYNTHSTDHTLPYPGIPDLLKELAIRNIKLAVASNKYQEAVDRIIRHYFPDIPFVSIQGQIENRPIKPDPTILKDIISGQEIAKDNVLMVGDSAVDIETARRAGIKSIAVDWGFCQGHDLRAAKPDYLVSSTSKILNLILQQP